jgi:hypothetical protein
MTGGSKLLLAIGALMAATTASATTVDYVYISADATPEIATFSVDSSQLAPLGQRIYTKPTSSYGTLEGSDYDFQHIYMSSSVLGGGLFNGSTPDASDAAFNLLGDPLFSGTPLAPTLKTGTFPLYNNEGGATPRITPSGTLTAFIPTTYDFDLKGVSQNTPFDITFDITSEPESYGVNLPNAFTVGPVFLTVNGVKAATGGATFFESGGFQFNNGLFGVGGVNYPGSFSGAALFTGPLYNAVFTPGRYVVMGDLAGDLEADSLTITREGGVPEPASWIMLIGGLGAVGALARRARHKYAPLGA